MLLPLHLFHFNPKEITKWLLNSKPLHLILDLINFIPTSRTSPCARQNQRHTLSQPAPACLALTASVPATPSVSRQPAARRCAPYRQQLLRLAPLQPTAPPTGGLRWTKPTARCMLTVRCRHLRLSRLAIRSRWRRSTLAFRSIKFLAADWGRTPEGANDSVANCSAKIYPNKTWSGKTS